MGEDKIFFSPKKLFIKIFFLLKNNLLTRGVGDSRKINKCGGGGDVYLVFFVKKIWSCGGDDFIKRQRSTLFILIFT